MRTRICFDWRRLLACCPLLLALPLMAAAQEGKPEEEQDAVQGLLGRLFLGAAPQGDSPFWIGVGCHPADEILRTRLELAKDQGLVIDEVVEGSPAAKAGLKKDDVIIAVGDGHVGQIEQLAKAVTSSDGRELKLWILRTGHELTLGVTPARRPSEGAAGRVVVITEGDEKDAKQEKDEKAQERQKQEAALDAARARLQKLLQEVQDKDQEPHPVPPAAPTPPVPPAPPGASRPAAGMPGMMPGAAGGGIAMAFGTPNPALPDDMQVTINKHGKKPAVVIVKQGDKRWQTTENELDMLPAEARAYAARLLGKPGAVGWQVMPGAGAMAVPARRTEVRLGESLNPAPAKNVELQGTIVKSVPGGIEVEIREGAEDKQAQSKPNQPNPQPTPRVRALELRLPEASPESRPADRSDARVRELQEQVEQLRRELERLKKLNAEQR